MLLQGQLEAAPLLLTALAKVCFVVQEAACLGISGQHVVQHMRVLQHCSGRMVAVLCWVQRGPLLICTFIPTQKSSDEPRWRQHTWSPIMPSSYSEDRSLLPTCCHYCCGTSEEHLHILSYAQPCLLKRDMQGNSPVSKMARPLRTLCRMYSGSVKGGPFNCQCAKDATCTRSSCQSRKTCSPSAEGGPICC